MVCLRSEESDMPPSMISPPSRKCLAEFPGSPTKSCFMQIVKKATTKPPDPKPVAGLSPSNKKLRADTAGSPADLPTPILSLPPEMLTTIFMMLDVVDKGRVAQVCRSWMYVAMVSMVWRFETVVIKANARAQCVYKFLSSLGGRKIVLNTWKGLNSLLTLPYTEPRTLSNLTHLILGEGIAIEDTNVQQIARTFKRLVLLKLVNTAIGHTTDVAIGHICDGLKKLEHLTLSLPGCGAGITDAGIKQLSASRLPLRFLGLHGCNSLTDESLRYISLGKPALEGLELVCNWASTEYGIKYVSAMRQVCYLKLTMVYDCNNNYTQLRLIASMPSLRAFVLIAGTTVDNNGIEILSNGSAKIERLILKGWSCITDISLEYVSTMPHLRQLSILSCDRLTWEGIEFLLQGNRKLISLKIRYCGGISSEVLDCIVANQPNLQWLSLDVCHVSEKSLAKAVRQLRHLTVLEVDDVNLLPELLLQSRT